MLIGLWVLLGGEVLGYALRYAERASSYWAALARARQLGRPCYILGAPDLGPTGSILAAPYGHGDPRLGDRVIDFAPSCAPNAVRWDLRKGLPWVRDDSIVVFESCVLEYIEGDPAPVARELLRASGGELYSVRVSRLCPVTHILTDSRHLIDPALTRRPRPEYLVGAAWGL